MFKVVGYSAAGALTIVSVITNARFGWTLGANTVDRTAYAATSVAIDVLKVGLPLLAMPLWANRRRALAVCAIAMWICCTTWSAIAALGFAASTRGETVAQRIADAKARTGWEATVERAERQIADLALHRPSAVVRAELNAAVVAGSVWQRSKRCTDITLDGSRAACAEVLRLRQELATAEEVERLENKVVAGRAQLATVSVAGADADPQATVLASLIGFDQTHIRAGIAFLMALILEAGSALGFAIVATATKGFPQPQHQTIYRHANPAQPTTQTQQGSAPSDNDIRRWALSGLDIDPVSSVPARRAYEGFCNGARGQGIEPPTETYFGRQLTKEIALLGGRKRRTRNATVYSGIGLKKPRSTPANGPSLRLDPPSMTATVTPGGNAPTPHPPDDCSHHGQCLPTGRKRATRRSLRDRKVPKPGSAFERCAAAAVHRPGKC